MSKRIWPLSCLFVVALFPQWTVAQVNYKSTMPDGRVIYGDKPVPGAAKVDQLKAPVTQGITPPSAKEKAVLNGMEKDRSARDAREQRIRAAQDAVKKAEAALAAGKEPLAGERQGTASGAQRITDAYYDRQKQLEADLTKARADLAAAQASAQTAQTTQRGGRPDPDGPPTSRSKLWLQDK